MRSKQIQDGFFVYQWDGPVHERLVYARLLKERYLLGGVPCRAQYVEVHFLDVGPNGLEALVRCVKTLARHAPASSHLPSYKDAGIPMRRCAERFPLYMENMLRESAGLLMVSEFEGVGIGPVARAQDVDGMAELLRYAAERRRPMAPGP